MDNGKGRFNPIEDEKYEKQMGLNKPMVFKVGEILEIRGSRFRIAYIQNNGKMVLKLLNKLQ